MAPQHPEDRAVGRIAVRPIERGSGFDPEETIGVMMEFDYGGIEVTKGLTKREAKRLIADLREAVA